MRLRARFLGPPALEQDIRLTSLLPGKGLALAAFLATEGVPVGARAAGVPTLARPPGAHCPHQPTAVAPGLKGKLLGTMLELDGSTLRFVGQSDLGQFEQARAEGDWESALSLWRGEFLAGLKADTDTLDDWLQTQREYWNRRWREAMLGRVGQLEQLGQATRALERLEKLIQTDWLSEELYARAIRLALKLGQRERALELLGRLEKRLQDELGLKPLPQTVALVQGPLQASSAEEVVSSAEIPMVGRQTAREQLTRWASAPGLVLVSGEGGVGKTRLLEEALAGALVLRAEESLLQSPFHPLVRALEAMQASLGILPEATRQELRRLLPQLPALNPEPDPNPEVARMRLLNALLEGVRLLAGDRALVLEDLHWADEATLGFVVELAARWAEAGGTMIINMRPEEAPARPGLERNLQQLRRMPVLRGEICLERLGLPGTQALVGAFLGLSEGPPLFAERIHRASGGNPLFTLEVLRQLQAVAVL